MKNSYNLQNLYTPVQPTVTQSADRMVYQEFVPHQGLQNLVYCYWQLKTNHPLEEAFSYKVVSDGCIDIVFELHNSSTNFIMGLSNTYSEFELENTFNYIGIRFLPTAFPKIFNSKASELTNRFEELSSVLPKIATFIKQEFDPSMSIKEIIKKLDIYFLSLITHVNFEYDPRIYNAIEYILKHKGVCEIQKLDTGISSRQLRRLFDFYIGDSPKTFSKIVRFQNFLIAKPSHQSLQKDRLFFDVGYYDQAHFIKDFKNHYGDIPSKALDKP